MKKLQIKPDRLLYAVMCGIMANDAWQRHQPPCSPRRVGRCLKELGYYLRKTLRKHDITVRLYPAGNGCKSGLKKTSECIVFTDNCDARHALAAAWFNVDRTVIEEQPYGACAHFAKKIEKLRKRGDHVATH